MGSEFLNAKCKVQNAKSRTNSLIKRFHTKGNWQQQRLAEREGSRGSPPSEAEQSRAQLKHFAFCILHFAFLFSPKKEKIALSYQDEKTRYHLISHFRQSLKMCSSTSDNGLTRRKLTGMLPCFISTGSRATDQPFCKDLHQPSSLWAEA